ncbi:hypothetical protein AGMMS49975_20600 [Clostridia bacterium]|nr:hypothetical protein AGMMS49975_20600 [Clostridia bacterium]
MEVVDVLDNYVTGNFDNGARLLGDEFVDTLWNTPAIRYTTCWYDSATRACSSELY